MGKRQTNAVVLSFAMALLLAATGVAGAQDALTAKLQPSGMIRVSRGNVELATVELNAHGPNWKHAPQETATARIDDLPENAGQRVTGTLPIPNTDGGAMAFTELVKPVPNGFHLEYDIAMAKTARLNGLQVSIVLPVKPYASKEVVVTRQGARPQIAGFPPEQSERSSQILSAEGAKVEIAKGTPEAIIIQLRGSTDVMVQDLRQWEREVFEIRFPAIMEDQGRELTPEDRFHLDLTITLAGPTKVE